MTRRLSERHHRRLSRMRSGTLRPEHGLDLALPGLHTATRAALAADQDPLYALAAENALLARELGRIQARWTEWRDDSVAHAERLEALLMRARGELIVMATHLAAMRDALAALRKRAARWLVALRAARRAARRALRGRPGLQPGSGAGRRSTRPASSVLRRHP